MDTCPIFICYRQDDGKKCAAGVYDILRDQTILDPQKNKDSDTKLQLDVYFDQAAPGVGDWKAVHEPHLKRARAIIVICSPGVKADLGEGDHVHQEINWWLKNREMAPILIDPLGTGDRYVPSSVLKSSPNIQRIRLVESEREALSDDARLAYDDRVRSQILGGIASSGTSFYQQELEKEKERVRRLERNRNIAIGLSLALLIVAGIAYWTFQLKSDADDARREADMAALEAEKSKDVAEQARELAQRRRVIENLLARAQAEAGLLRILQSLPEYDNYKTTLKDLADEFRARSSEFRKKFEGKLPVCDQVGSFSVYERQLVEVGIDDLDENFTLFAYLAVVPGSSPRPGDWAPSVLDVFFAKRGQFTPGRDLSRGTVKAKTDSVASDNRWSLLMGLGTSPIFTHNGKNYRIRDTSLSMNDEGDMIMAFEVCREIGQDETR